MEINIFSEVRVLEEGDDWYVPNYIAKKSTGKMVVELQYNHNNVDDNEFSNDVMRLLEKYRDTVVINK